MSLSISDDIRLALTDPKRTDYYAASLTRTILGHQLVIEVVIGLGSEALAHQIARHLAISGRRSDIVRSCAATSQNGVWSLDPSYQELARDRQVLIVVPSHQSLEEIIPPDLIVLVKSVGGILKGVLYYDGSLLTTSAGW